MPSYMQFTSTRTTVPDPVALLSAVRAAVDPVAGIGGTGPYTIKKTTPFVAADITAVQTAIDTAPALTPQRAAQNDIDGWTVNALKAVVLALIDQLNIIRVALPTPLPAITPTQAVAAIRAKAGTL